MPKRFSSTYGHLQYALNLAKIGKFAAALNALRVIETRRKNSHELRLVAQINNRCGRLENAKACWLEIERRGDIAPGDYHMLGSLQVRLKNIASAVSCFRREIEISAISGNPYFSTSSAMRLADLLFMGRDFEGARQALAHVENNAGEYLESFGFTTKQGLLEQIDRREMQED